MLRPLRRSDTAEVLRLLDVRPLHNLFLAHVVRVGALGVIPGFTGLFEREGLAGVLFVAAGGATALGVRDASACAPLAQAAADGHVQPRHIMGPEDTSLPFWEAYRPCAAPVVWERREPVYLLERGGLQLPPLSGRGRVERATERDLAELVDNSAAQYAEDLRFDRRAEDPVGFHTRHEREVGEGRWWVLRDGGRIAFQVHVGAESPDAVQIGGVFTAPELRRKGYATRGLVEISERLLRRKSAVTLFCDEANAPARRIYERVGYAVRLHQRSFLLESPAATRYA
jgi:GNAT superfamily N-acetyltransferase